MTDFEILMKPQHSALKRWQIARRRVTRWFRPPEAELVRRHHLMPHPNPVAPPSAPPAAAATEHRR
jgi:hypothetical protein